MKTIIKLWLLVLWVMAVTSCSTTRQIKKCEKCFSMLDTAKTYTKDTVWITQDTVLKYVYIPADTTYQYLLIECDSTGTATIKTSKTVKGNRSDISTTLKDNKLNIQATCKSLLDSIQTLNTVINKQRNKTTTVFVPKLIEAKLTWWQKIKIRFGGWAFLIIALYIGYKGLKTYYKVNTPMGLLLTIRRKLLR
jgi:hypothetical protein